MSMEKKTVAVIFGGCSTEYEVSLESASSVIDHLDRERYEVLLIGITREGEWFRYHGETAAIRENTWRESGACVPAFLSPCRGHRGLLELRPDGAVFTPVDVAFPVLHGRNGEDGTLQGLLEMAAIPFVGCDTLSSAVCMDKDYAHTLAAAAGIPIPATAVIYPGDPREKILAAAAEIGYPVYVKPSRAGSSFGITKAHDEQELIAGVREAFVHDGKVVMEETIPGWEVGCAVLGNRDLLAGEVDQIRLGATEFFDYTEKYNLVTSQILVPAPISSEKRDEIRATACRLYRILGCRGMARVDMFLTPEGKVIFNEANTIPGFTTHSRYPGMLAAAGYSFGWVVNRLVELALEQD